MPASPDPAPGPAPDPAPDPAPTVEGLAVGTDRRPRCWWSVGDALYERYHDMEWGRPVDDDRRLFEKISLEGFMAGLSWLTILRKRDHFRDAFHRFDPAAIAEFTPDDADRLMGDPGIVRNRAKIEATINNARRYAELVAEFGSLATYLWRHEPPPEARPSILDYATLTSFTFSAEAKAVSKDLLRRGWKFVGPTTIYSAMEAMGLVDDHLEGCFARLEVERDRAAFVRPT